MGKKNFKPHLKLEEPKNSNQFSSNSKDQTFISYNLRQSDLHSVTDTILCNHHCCRDTQSFNGDT